MTTAAAVILGINVLFSAASPFAAGQQTDSLVVDVQADGKLRPVGELDAQVEAVMPVCAAVASDEATGALGDSDANTRAAAVDGAMTECRGYGGKECRITSVACDPTRSSD